jgi:hypothetical protein
MTCGAPDAPAALSRPILAPAPSSAAPPPPGETRQGPFRKAFAAGYWCDMLPLFKDKSSEVIKAFTPLIERIVYHFPMRHLLTANCSLILLLSFLGIHEKQKLLGIAIEPEKEIVLTVTSSDKVDHILEAIVRVSDLSKPGMGIAFIVPVEKVVGVAHGFGEITRENPRNRRT